MGKRSYVPPIEIRVGQTRDYQDGVDRMTCRTPGCKRWRVDGKTKFCADHQLHKEQMDGIRKFNRQQSALMPAGRPSLTWEEATRAAADGKL